MKRQVLDEADLQRLFPPSTIERHQLPPEELDRLSIARHVLTQDEIYNQPPDWCYWKGSVFEKYAGSWCRVNAWRIAYYIGDFHDAMQVCALDWVRCRNAYMNTVNSPAQFMALYKATLYCTFNTYSVKDTRMRTTQSDVVALNKHNHHSDLLDFNFGTLTSRLSKASKELKAALHTLATANTEAIVAILGSPSHSVTNTRLLRFSGQPITHDILLELQALLGD